MVTFVDRGSVPKHKTVSFFEEDKTNSVSCHLLSSGKCFDHNKKAALLSLFAIGCAMGSLLGGLIGDRISRIYPSRGCIMGAQFSAFMGVCFSWFLIVVIPQSVSSWPTFAVTLFFMGLMISWNGSCANNPMFAEVVPTQHRTMIYAFDRAFEGSFSSFAAPIVGILSEAFALSEVCEFGAHSGMI
ncbi:uncharacterized protein LOC113297209 [Papaver somniferum]|uniref:uncharacterized protein LOC113297209 n=1 Tax=Papaver somniferum TaxID=3469 RepID=UPI000E6F796B|nr:uncharacterized protein LOC113297209 [Papaver somniferum]